MRNTNKLQQVQWQGTQTQARSGKPLPVSYVQEVPDAYGSDIQEYALGMSDVDIVLGWGAKVFHCTAAGTKNNGTGNVDE